MASTIRNALVAALVTAGLTIPVLGLQLVREGTRTHIETHWNLVLIACAAVFVIQLLRPALARIFGGLSFRVPGAERLNFVHRTPTGQRVLVALIILAAIILTVLPEMAREFADYRMLIFGLVMVLMMIWRPEGLLPVKRPHVELTR